ncbi:MAG: hypothetical protein ACOCV9_06970 [Marinilabiliaceae bacterium]
MSYFEVILMYLVWPVTVVVGYYASVFAVNLFDRKWKEQTEAEEEEA